MPFLKKCLILLFIFLCINPSWAELLEDKAEIRSVRTNSFGGFHTALNDDVSVLFSNPAGFYLPERQIAVTELTVKVSGPVFDILTGVTSGNVADIIPLLEGIYTSFDLTGPAGFAYAGRGLGFGVYNNTGFRITSSGPTSLNIAFREEIIICGGPSIKIPLPVERHRLFTGVMLKAVIRNDVGFSKDAADIDGLLSMLDPAALLSEPAEIMTGLGFDLGFLYKYGDRLSAGLVFRDLYTPTKRTTYSSISDFIGGAPSASSSSGRIPLDLAAGLMYTPSMGRFENYFGDLKLLLDYNDALDFVTHPDTARNIVLKFGLGAEAVVMDILALRLGFYQGLLNAGLGLDLGIWSISLAMFGTEMSTQPGIKPVYNVQFGADVRF